MGFGALDSAMRLHTSLWGMHGAAQGAEPQHPPLRTPGSEGRIGGSREPRNRSGSKAGFAPEAGAAASLRIRSASCRSRLGLGAPSPEEEGGSHGCGPASRPGGAGPGQEERRRPAPRCWREGNSDRLRVDAPSSSGSAMEVPAVNLKAIVAIHWLLTVWGCMVPWPSSYAWSNFTVLSLGVWAVAQRDSIDAILMFLTGLVLTILTDIVLFGLYYPRDQSVLTDTVRFSSGMAIFSLLLKPVSCFLAYQMYRERGGEYSFNVGIGQDRSAYQTIDAPDPPRPFPDVASKAAPPRPY